MTILSKGEQESFSTLLNRFKKKMRKSGILRDYSESLEYEKPSVQKKKRYKR